MPDEYFHSLLLKQAGGWTLLNLIPSFATPWKFSDFILDSARIPGGRSAFFSQWIWGHNAVNAWWVLGVMVAQEMVTKGWVGWWKGQYKDSRCSIDRLDFNQMVGTVSTHTGGDERTQLHLKPLQTWVFLAWHLPFQQKSYLGEWDVGKISQPGDDPERNDPTGPGRSSGDLPLDGEKTWGVLGRRRMC